MRLLCLLGLSILNLEGPLGASGLDCFTCTWAWSVKECMQSDPLTCEWGQICVTTEERGGLADVRYTKGCMDSGECLALENLNSDCDHDPSVCVYCCGTELCNGSVTSLPLRGTTIVLSIIALLNNS